MAKERLRTMSKKIVIEKELDLCNKCPYFNEHEDTSVCFDSFDEPNYEFYCKHSDADNSSTSRAKWNDEHGKFIGLSYSSFDKDCSIPDWCPLEDIDLE